jgi:hypothetical protein
MDSLLDKLKFDFALKDRGALSYFLGIEECKVADGICLICLTQNKYTSDLLKHARMLACKPTPTPLATSSKLSMHGGEVLIAEDATRYWSIVGALQYLTLTCPDISSVVNKVFQYLHAPTTDH